MNTLLDHLHIPTLARLAAELIADYSQPSGPNNRGLTFHTEAAANAYRELVTAGYDRAGDEFFTMIDDAVAAAQNA